MNNENITKHNIPLIAIKYSWHEKFDLLFDAQI